MGQFDMKLPICICSFVLLSCASSVVAQQGGQPGKFDYYLLTLSWSPEYCHSHPTDTECSGAKHYGFVVHGLWPEFQNGGGPENCSNAPGLANPATMLDIMPDLGLIQHEWTTHGTCSGLSATDYFNLIRKAFTSLRIPAQFAAPTTQLVMSPLQVKQSFEQLNANWKDVDIMINCTGNYLQELEFCLTKNLGAMACSAPRDCNARTIRIPPVP
jgi:ribonuclease T2